jgi:hypothetical protein
MNKETETVATNSFLGIFVSNFRYCVFAVQAAMAERKKQIQILYKMPFLIFQCTNIDAV